MWKKIQDSPHYFIQLFDEDGYDIYVTDYINIWSIKLTRAEFIKCLQKSNERLMYNDEDEFLSNGVNMISDPDKLTKKYLERKENGNFLEMTLLMSIEYPFQLKCKLTKGSEQLFYDHITNPLLKNINDLQSSHNALIDLLKKKDEEISAYKSKGNELSLISVKTNEFSEESHMRRYNTSDTNNRLYEELQTALKNPINEKIDIKQNIQSTSEIKVEQKQHIKIEPEHTHDAQSNECIQSTTNLINIESIKEENTDSNHITSYIQIKRRRKKPNF